MRIAPGFAIHVIEYLEALVMGGDEAPEARFHRLVPDFCVVAIRKTILAADDLLQQRLELGLALLLGRGRTRAQGKARSERRQPEGGGAAPLPRRCSHQRSAFWSTCVIASAIGISTAAVSRR